MIDTSASGWTVIGDVIERMEKHASGLGADFYSVFCSTLYRWMRIYDRSDAEMFVERWTESIEYDPSSDGQTLEEYCIANEIHIPDVEGSVPLPIRNSKGSAASAVQRSATSCIVRCSYTSVQRTMAVTMYSSLAMT